MTSVLSIGINRVLAAEATVALLGHDAKDVASVFPVQIPKGAAVPAVTINRLFERKEGGETTAVLAITCMAKTVQEVETLGATLIDEIDGTTDFAFADLVGITCDKAGPDVTGFDAERGLMLRQIEFVITW
jgi:hypothetical protein